MVDNKEQFVRDDELNFFIGKGRKDFSIVENNLYKIIEEVKISEEKGFNFFNDFNEDFVLKQLANLKNYSGRGKLFGVPVTVKDAICVKGLSATAGSKILSGYKPVFDATVIEKIKKEGAIILAKTTQDEFGFGTFSTNTSKVPLNPFDIERSCGGSSGGSAGFSAFSSCYHVSVGESTGGSIACPASFNGVVGFTPTYGLVSRNGLIDYANSLDKIGSFGRNISDASLLLEVMSGFDEKDSTSLKNNFVVEDFALKKIGVIKNFFDNCDESVKKVFLEKINFLKKFFIVEEIELPLNVKYALSTYYIISCSEASTNLAKLCGLRFGIQEEVIGKHFDEYFSDIRSKNFSEESKRRIILGTFARMSGYRNAYYLKAMKVRTMLIQEFNNAFKNFDLLLTPTMPIVAPKFSEIKSLSPLQNYSMDLCTVPANLGGFPNVSFNAGFFNGLPVGLMAIAPHLEEKRLFSLGKILESEKK